VTVFTSSILVNLGHFEEKLDTRHSDERSFRDVMLLNASLQLARKMESFFEKQYHITSFFKLAAIYW